MTGCTKKYCMEIVMFLSGLIMLSITGCGSDFEIDPGDSQTDDTNNGPDATDGDIDEESETSETDDATCEPKEVVLETPDLNLKKFALSMFHYNIQYVAGGLEYDLDGEMQGFCGPDCLGWTDELLQDWIITESLEPVLDFYIAHPNWRVTFEMQGQMLEAIAMRFPEILEKLRTAAQSGQVELVSFHYSAQLFLAFPVLDLERSVAETKEIFERYCVPLSTVVFNQEGQAGEGKHDFMKNHGYEISVFPKNLYNYVRNGEEKWPWYEDHGVAVLIGPGEVDPASGIDVTWTFFDDGELLSTPADPYFAPWTSADLTEIAAYETKLTDLEANGYKITSITDYINHMKAQNIEQKTLPRVVDGTWQPTSTSSILRWMGGRSLAPYNNKERDAWLRAQNYQARTELEAAEIMVLAADEAGIDTIQWQETLKQAWREMTLAEVTDATGITPWEGEFFYSVIYNEQVLETSTQLVTDSLAALGWPHAMIDLGTKTATSIDDIPLPEAPDDAEAPMEVEITAPTRTVDARWTSWDNIVFQLNITFGPSADPTALDVEQNKVAVNFPRSVDRISYSPGLMDDTLVEYSFTQFNFQREEIYLPLANGLIGLGNNWWVVKDCRAAHMAVRVPNTPQEQIVQFLDETADPELPPTWVFHVVQGTVDEALALARRINTGPVLYR